LGCWGRGTGAGAGGGSGMWGSAAGDPGRSGSEFSGFFVVVISLKRGVVVSFRRGWGCFNALDGHTLCLELGNISAGLVSELR
jgi:hypothetical protein